MFGMMVVTRAEYPASHRGVMLTRRRALVALVSTSLCAGAAACARGGPGSVDGFCRAIAPGAPAPPVEARATALGFTVIRPTSVPGFVVVGRKTFGADACEVHVSGGTIVSAKYPAP